jgi:hypothetical protein
MLATVNAAFMAEQRKYAEGFPGVAGMMHVVPVTVLPHMKLYRFAKAATPDDRLYGASWWIGYSAYQALCQIAGPSMSNLRRSARERLAVPPEWGNAMDLLVCAHVLQPLSAWSGTPRTARSKDRNTQQYGSPWEPDRSITQLFLPGLSKHRPDNTFGPFIPWSEVLKPGMRSTVAGD